MCLAVGLIRGIFFDTLGYLYLSVCFFPLRLEKLSIIMSLHKLLFLLPSSSYPYNAYTGLNGVPKVPSQCQLPSLTLGRLLAGLT